MPDLNTIPGFAALQALTKGDSRIKIAVLDGPADLDRACFQGANISKAKAFWQQTLEPIDPIYVQQELQIRTLGDKKKALKKTLKEREKQEGEMATLSQSDDDNEEILSPSDSNNEQISLSGSRQSPHSIATIFNAVLEDKDALLREQYHKLNTSKQRVAVKSEPPAILNTAPSIAELKSAIAALEAEIKTLEDSIPKPVRDRLSGVFHATGIFGTMFGQPGSPVEGVAPYCTAINIPLFETATSDESLSPLNMAHAFNLALELGVNIIHCAACHPTQTGFAHEMIQKAVKQCQDNNILIVAPSGNNKGEWFCAPAILPNVLAVGMMKDNGQPANYSNWGGQYQKQGILAPGENMVAAQPGTDEPARQEGTSLAAPLMTGISALLMSLQLQRGEQPNAEAVRQAILNSAIPCDPQEVEEPERCLVGKLNISGAFQLLTGERLLTELPAATQISQNLQTVYKHYESTNERLGERGRTFQACLLAGEDPSSDNIYRRTNVYIAAQTGIKAGDYVLDAGCGAGGPSIDIAQSIPNIRIEGINLSQAQVTTARKLVREAGLSDRIRVQVGDYHHLPFQDEVFDVVLFLETIGYASDLSDRKEILTEAYRVLRPGGILYIKEIFRKESPLTEKQEQELVAFQKREPHNTPLITDVCAALQLAGFQNIQPRDLSNILTMCSPTQKDCPFVCGDIKAQKSLVVPSIHSTFSSANSHHRSQIADSSAFSEGGIAIAPTRSTNTHHSNLTLSAASPASLSPSTITPSAVSSQVYALGSLGYDFGSEARRDTFKQRMPAVSINGVLVPANPYDARQMVNHLELSPAEGKSLIWTLNQELTPIYALEPQKAFASEIYAVFGMLLAGQIHSEASDDYIERVSIPGNLTDRTVELFSGQIVPVLALPNVRGMYGWQVNALVEAAVTTTSPEASEADSVRMRRTLKSFLHRIYYDLRNLGHLDRDRALNFAATNAFQAASTFAEALNSGMGLDSIEIEKSPFCRLNSNCWDVKLKFFDSEDGKRSKKVFRFTIDVANLMPVTLGKVRSWSVPR